MPKIYTYKNLQDEVLSWLDESGTTGVTLNNVKASLQQAHLRRLAERDWNFMLWPAPITFTTSSGQRQYVLHSEYHKGLYFFNRTNKAYLIETNSRQLPATGARWNTDTGSPNRFVLWGRSPVGLQPPTSSVLSIVSSNSGDTTQTVTLEGTDGTDLTLVSETLTAQGGSTVTGVTTFSHITGVTLSAPFAGSMLLSAGAQPLLLLSAGELGRSYPILELLSNPTTASTIEYRFYRQPRELEGDYDLPNIPPPFTQILVWDALIDLAAYNTDVDMKNVQLWSRNQQKLEDAMIEWDDAGGTLEAEPRYVRTLDLEDDGLPRVYSS